MFCSVCLTLFTVLLLSHSFSSILVLHPTSQNADEIPNAFWGSLWVSHFFCIGNAHTINTLAEQYMIPDLKVLVPHSTALHDGNPSGGSGPLCPDKYADTRSRRRFCEAATWQGQSGPQHLQAPHCCVCTLEIEELLSSDDAKFDCELEVLRRSSCTMDGWRW